MEQSQLAFSQACQGSMLQTKLSSSRHALARKKNKKKQQQQQKKTL